MQDKMLFQLQHLSGSSVTELQRWLKFSFLAKVELGLSSEAQNQACLLNSSTHVFILRSAQKQIMSRSLATLCCWQGIVRGVVVRPGTLIRQGCLLALMQGWVLTLSHQFRSPWAVSSSMGGSCHVPAAEAHRDSAGIRPSLTTPSR